MAKAIMIQGTMSNAGKSFLVAGICRILKQDGYRVAPFKSQNMALNSYITEDGLEMGRAQVMQAEACGEEPSVYMNPILLKPTTDVGSQVIVNGVPRGNMWAADYFKYKTELIPDILNAWRKLSEAYDVIVIEGAGSPAEINLKENDIVNMGLAKLLDAPVLLVGDIDRGGVFAQLAGTLALLEEPERQRIKGFVMNKFRGDVELLRPGLDMLWERCHVETIGVIPYANLDLDDEDSLSDRLTGERNGEEGKKPHAGILKIAIIRLPRISNFTDFNVLQAMDGVKVSYVSRASELGEPHMVILPGTKSTISDMRWLRESGLEAAILKLQSHGVTIFGICGGFQMLGRTISDPLGVESEKEEPYETLKKTAGLKIASQPTADGSAIVISDRRVIPETMPLAAAIAGMGILPFETVFQGEKVRRRVVGKSGMFTGDYIEASEKRVSGYEIHMGHSVAAEGRNTDNSTEDNPAGKKEYQSYENEETGFDENGLTDAGLIYQEGNVFGTYVHGIFDEQEFRESFLGVVAKRNNIDLAVQTISDYRAYKESQYDQLADVVRGGMDMKKFYGILGLRPEKYFHEISDKGCGDERNAGKNGGDSRNEKSPEKNEEVCGDEKSPEKNDEACGDEESAKKNSRNSETGIFSDRGNGKTTGKEVLGETGVTAGGKDISEKSHRRGFLHLYYGDGKGKTTAAVGLAVRAAGAGKKVVFCQFLKSGESGELTVLGCTPGIRILRSKEKFGFSWTLSEAEKTRLREIHTGLFLEAMRLVETGQCDVLILDEVCDALRTNLLDDALFYCYLKTAGEGPEDGCEWVLTGRDPDERILSKADYVTQMKKERHPFDDGVKARRGIEF